MKKILIWTTGLAVLLWLSALPAAFAQGSGAAHGKASAAHGQKAKGEKGKAAKKGKPEEKGLEHAEQVANPQGVEHGIEKAEAKQAEQKGAGKESTAAAGKGKPAGKGKGKH